MLRALLCLLLVPVLAQAQSGKPAYQRGYLQPQFVQDAAGNVGMLWIKPTAEGHDLFLARRQPTGALQDPVRVNAAAGDVQYLPLDQARPGLAAGPDGAIGVSWFDRQGRLFVAVSRDGGQSFLTPVEVAPGHARPEHAFSDVAFDAAGNTFVTWIDCTGAPAGHEEPAQLWAARIDRDERALIENLTGAHTQGICGCCRPDLSARGRELTVDFRMAGESGYRDIHRIRFGADLKAGAPEAMGTPLWKIDGCPMAGPVSGGEFAWFLDGSTGARRLMEAHTPQSAAVVVPVATVADPESPRLVPGSEGPRWMLYLPGAEQGQVLVRDGGRWRVAVDAVPPFCSDIALVEGQLLMVGEKEGTLWMEARPLD